MENPEFEPGTECVAKYDFKGATPRDLPFTKGELLIIIKAENLPNWFYARRKSDGKEGMIPINYVKKKYPVYLPWFFGKISRDQTADLLAGGEPGLFLVRESTNFPGEFTLSVCSLLEVAKVDHYRILRQNGMLTIDEETFYHTLQSLVDHYTEDSDGLCTKLTKPLIRDMEVSTSSAMA